MGVEEERGDGGEGGGERRGEGELGSVERRNHSNWMDVCKWSQSVSQLMPDMPVKRPEDIGWSEKVQMKKKKKERGALGNFD